MPPKRHSTTILMLLVSHAAFVVVVAVHSTTSTLKILQRSSSTVSLPFLSPSSLSASTRSMETPIISSLSTIAAIRGGADAVAVDQDETETEDQDECETESESDEEEEEEDESEEDETATPTPSQGPPIKMFIRTNLNIPLLDQSLEFTASQKRDIASIKLSISRQMLGRPPASSQTLRLGDRVVQDDELISELLEEWEDEHEEDDDDNDDNDDDDDTVLPFVLDIPPLPFD